MQELVSQTEAGKKRFKSVGNMSAMALVLMLGGCSWVPDWADPTEWFGSSDDSDRPQQIEQANGDKAFPSLGTVPATPGTSVSIAEADSIKQGLSADREKAKYTDQTLRADTSVQTAPAPKVPVVAPPQPTAAAPVAAPVAVTPQPSTVAPIQLTRPAAVPAVRAAPAQMAPQTGTTVIGGDGTSIQSIYQQQLAASSATVTTLPANIGFQAQPIHPLGNSAVALPQIVKDTYNQPIVISSTGQVINEAAASGSTRMTPSYGGQSLGAATSGPDLVVKFARGSHRVGAGDKQKLKKIADAAKSSGARIMVVGHASSRTRDLSVERHMMVNLRISQQRADSVVKALRSLGVSGDRIIARAISDSQPIYAEAMPRGEAENRRTEIFLVN